MIRTRMIRLLEQFDPKQPRDAHGRWTEKLWDETAESPAPKAGDTIIVYRVGGPDGARGLANRNGGNAEAVADHLFRYYDSVMSDDHETPLPPPGNYVHAYRVKLRKDPTAYRRYNKGAASDYPHASGSADPEAVGRHVHDERSSWGGWQVWYSFPEGGKWDAEHVATVPVEEIQKIDSWFGKGFAGNGAADSLRKVFEPYISKKK